MTIFIVKDASRLYSTNLQVVPGNPVPFRQAPKIQPQDRRQAHHGANETRILLDSILVTRRIKVSKEWTRIVVSVETVALAKTELSYRAGGHAECMLMNGDATYLIPDKVSYKQASKKNRIFRDSGSGFCCGTFTGNRNLV